MGLIEGDTRNLNYSSHGDWIQHASTFFVLFYLLLVFRFGALTLSPKPSTLNCGPYGNLDLGV